MKKIFMRKLNNKKLRYIAIIISLLFMFILLSTIFSMNFNGNEEESSAGSNIFSSDINNSNISTYFDVTGIVVANDGKYYYSIYLTPINEQYEIEVQSVSLLLSFNGKTTDSKTYPVKIEVTDFVMEDDKVHMTGVYEDSKRKFANVTLEEDFIKYITIRGISAQIWQVSKET